MGNKKSDKKQKQELNKSEYLFIFIVFFVINGAALYVISKYWNVNFTILFIVFVFSFVIIDIVKRIRNHIILTQIKEVENKQREESRKKQEEYNKLKEEKKRIAIAQQRARLDSLQKGKKGSKRKDR